MPAFIDRTDEFRGYINVSLKSKNYNVNDSDAFDDIPESTLVSTAKQMVLNIFFIG